MEQTPHQLESADAGRNQASDTASSTAPKGVATKSTFEGYAVSSDLPLGLAVARDEIVLLRAFLSKEIDAILFEQEKSEHGE